MHGNCEQPQTSGMKEQHILNFSSVTTFTKRYKYSYLKLQTTTVLISNLRNLIRQFIRRKIIQVYLASEKNLTDHLQEQEQFSETTVFFSACTATNFNPYINQNTFVRLLLLGSTRSLM